MPQCSINQNGSKHLNCVIEKGDEKYLNEARDHIQKARRRNQINRIDIPFILKGKAGSQ